MTATPHCLQARVSFTFNNTNGLESGPGQSNRAYDRSALGNEIFALGSTDTVVPRGAPLAKPSAGRPPHGGFPADILVPARRGRAPMKGSVRAPKAGVKFFYTGEIAPEWPQLIANS